MVYGAGDLLINFSALLVVICTVLPSASCVDGPPAGDVRQTITRLLSAIQKERVTKDETFRAFPPRWAETKGLYRSYVHINAVGGEAADLFRRDFQIPDANMFVTSFVLTALLQAHQLGTVDLTAYETEIAESLSTVASFHDKNRPASVPSYVFWPQTLVNGTWSAGAPNLLDPLTYLDDADLFVEALLKTMHLDKFAADAGFVDFIIGTFLQAFKIPPDTDDSSVNLALGGMLSQLSAQFPSWYATWEKNNPSIADLFALESQFSYKPLAGDDNTTMANLVDPRTYFVLSPYLDQLNAAGKLNATALPTTWLLSVPTERKAWPEESMPFNTNNVDLCVVANFLYGTSHAVLQGLNGGAARAFFESDAEFQNLYVNAAMLLNWAITSQTVFKRPDISLLYYPSLYDFLWMVARTSFLLDQHANDELPAPMLSALELLSQAMQTTGTEQLLSMAQSDSDGTYWDDFLGDAESPPHGEDRLFSTALAVNAFISTWTEAVPNTTCLRWSATAPAAVKTNVASAVAFLNNQTLDGTLKLVPMNAFFSGSMKVNSCDPFSYPGTYARFINGTPFNPHDPKMELAESIWGVEGYVPAAEYKSMLLQSWFNNTVPLHFNGFNSNGGWPFWSSPSMTYSLSLLALSQYVALDDCPAATGRR